MFRKAFATAGWRAPTAGPAGRASTVERLRASLAGIHLSIRAKILLALAIVLLMMALINAVLLVQMLNYSRQYDAIIKNITTANSISGNIKPDIDTAMWNIVAGKTEFTQGKQYTILKVNDKLQWMTSNATSAEAKIRLEIIQRTMKTLTYYVDRMGEQIARKSKVAENEAVLENVRGVSSVVEEVVQEYVLFEVHQAEQQYSQMQEGFTRWSILYLILLVGAIGFSVIAAWAISPSIYIPGANIWCGPAEK